MTSKELFEHLVSSYWKALQGVNLELFQQLYLSPLWKQGLITERAGGYIVGPQWALIQPYEESLREAREAQMSLEQLARQSDWIELEHIELKS